MSPISELLQFFSRYTLVSFAPLLPHVQQHLALFLWLSYVAIFLS